MYTNYTNNQTNNITAVNEQKIDESDEFCENIMEELELSLEFIEFAEKSKITSQKAQQLAEDFYKIRNEFIGNLEDTYFDVYGVHFEDKK